MLDPVLIPTHQQRHHRAKALNMVLGAAGLAEESTVWRPPQEVNCRLPADGSVRLRRSGAGHIPANEHARACLQSCLFVKWGHLVDHEPLLRSTQLLDEED